MQKKKLKSKICVLFFLFIIASPIIAKGGDEHSWDMFCVLGLSNECYDSVSNLFKEINKCIDQYNDNGFYTKLQSRFKYFSWGSYGHRIICHWGFDIDKDLSDRTYQDSLAKIFNAKIYLGYSKIHPGEELTEEIWHKEWNEFLCFIREYQSKQNEFLTNITKQTLGVNSTVSRSIAAILYYTHLLGDHIEHAGSITGDAVLDLDKIEKNLEQHIKMLSRHCNWFYSDYKQSVNRILPLNDSERAQAILNTLKLYIPSILEYEYSEEFATKNLIFSNNMDLYDVA